MKSKSLKPSDKVWLAAAIGFSLLFLIAVPRTAQGQWTTSGNDISNTNSGNVGVGTSTPAHRLDVLVNAQWVARFKKTDATNGGIIIDAAASYNPNLALAVNGTNKWFLHSNSGSSDAFQFLDSGGTARFTLTQAGNVGIGTTNPLAKLGMQYGSDYTSGIHIGQGSAATGLSIWHNDASLTSSYIETRYDNAGSAMYFRMRASGTPVNALTILGSGYVGIGTTAPNAALHVVKDTGTSVAAVARLRSTNSTAKTTRLQFEDYNAAISDGLIDFDVTSGTAAGSLLKLGVNSTSQLVLKGDGNVGIGTSAPGYKLDVSGTINATGVNISGSPIAGSVFGRSGAVVAATNDYTWAQIDKTTSSLANLATRSAGDLSSGTLPDARFPSTLPSASGANLTALNASNIASGTVPTARMGTSTADATTFLRGDNTWAALTSSQWISGGSNSINYAASGNVGVGTSNPTSKLHVTGDGKFTGNLTVDGNIAAKYQDVAEWVPTSEQLATATVVVLDTHKSNQVVASSQAYDTRVAGVISAQPGIALGESGAGKVLVATTGRVLVNVDASRSAIHIGDLLVTSDVSGMAMKSEPIKLGDRLMHMPGTILGKALEPLEKGSGKILVLLSLQ